MLLRNQIINIFCLILFFSIAKINGQESYDKLRGQYENLNENNEAALKYVNLYIQVAKKEKNYVKLDQGYRDGAFFSSNKAIKLKYADSAIIAAKKSDNNTVLSSSYLYKGSLYYFYYKNYSAALEQYLKAYQLSKNGEDNYLKYKIIYQMGLVKSYLGYYDEALGHFRECITYFEPKTKEKNHPNQIYNDNKGYLNSLHQAIVCYQKIKNYKKADSLTTIGLNFNNQSKNYSSEKAHFLKSKGISDYYHKNYNVAEKSLNQALPILRNEDDIYWTSVSEFYIGKIFLETGKEDSAIKQFEKVDSIFQKKQFIFPELQENYELLISYYRKKRDDQQEFTYTKELLKVDNILKRDFPKLSSNIHQNYDNQILEDAKSKLESRSRLGGGTILILIIIVIILSFGIWQYYQNTKRIQQKYSELEKKLQQHSKDSKSTAYENISVQSKSIIRAEIFTEIQKQLEYFEINHGFRESGLTIDQLAETFDTNKSYLSQYINDTKGMNFSKYLSTLRINYITQLMYDNPKYLRLKIQGLADECGIGSRQNFSDLFQEINNIRPTDFIKKRKAEIEKFEKKEEELKL